ncbi:MAG: DUF11 domain-containing protein [Candidatus Vogelbacteria bacterium]|nr:DUF11 domain-containing protein [Candidatus Vogelbacteria bacterium]
MNERPEDKIERLKHRLYTPDNSLTPVRRSALSTFPANPSDQTESQNKWSPGPISESVRAQKRLSPLVIVFLLAAAFFLVAAGVAVYVFFRGGNLVSPANVGLLIDGPQTVKAGETLTLQVLAVNRNATALQSVDLIVEYPVGARSSVDLTKDLVRTRSVLGSINPGAVANQTIKAVVFGEKESEQEIRVTIEYRLADSNAIFDKTASFRYSISDSPLTITADWPTEVNAGQLLTLAFEVKNNSAVSLKGLVLKGDYPPGFIFRSATPAPMAGRNEFWRLGELAAGSARRLTVTGLLEGQHDDPKSFRFSAGTVKAATGEIDLIYGELFKIVTIKRPSVDLTLVLNGEPSGGELAASSGELLRADITWVNNSSTEITDGRIEARLKGEILDPRSVTVSDGFWQSADNLIVWQSGTKPALARLSPGAGGQASFTFSTRSLLDAGASRQLIQNPNLELEIRFTGRQVTAGLPDESIESAVNQEIKINTILQLAAAARYSGGPFANTGPLPPRVGQETTYTIVWSVINSSNAVREAAVRATLPTYVRWLGAAAPAEEAVSFNEATGEVIWNLGVVEAGRGVVTAAREAAFQIALRPSVSQVGETPVLVVSPTLTGADTFTGEVLISSRRSLDTRLLNDSGFRSGDERVVP